MAFGGKIAVATDINPFKTRVNESISLSVGCPMCMVRAIVVEPSDKMELQRKKINGNISKQTEGFKSIHHVGKQLD